MISCGIDIDITKITNGTKFDIINFLIIIANSLKIRLNLS